MGSLPPLNFPRPSPLPLRTSLPQHDGTPFPLCPPSPSPPPFSYQHDAQQHLLQMTQLTVLLQHAGSLAEESVTARELNSTLGLACSRGPGGGVSVSDSLTQLGGI